MRRLLPLVFLLKLSLLFPDQVPSRLGLAMRAASTKRLAKKLHEQEGGSSRVAEDLLALVTALGAHDRRTRGHSERVRAVTMLLADELGLEREERDKLEWAALLHDLGKLDVPPEILNKKGPPTDEEWAVLRTHPAGGPAHAACLSEWLGDWIHAMDQHHERFDGSGYPFGLHAEEIALSGRIVAVSDAFEVMTATRSYKEPMTTQAARDELVRCAGAHFDPRVVRAFMAISIGDIHRALGPTSWLASIPVVGNVTHGIGTSTAGLLLGGSVNPALAAAAALFLAPMLDQPQPPPSAPTAAIALVSESVDDSTDSSRELAAPTGSEAPDIVRGVGSDGGPDHGDTDEGGGDDPDLPPEDDNDLVPDVELPPVDPAVDDLIDDVVGSGEVLAGELLRELGVDEVVADVETLVDPLVEPVEEAVDETVAAVEETVDATDDPVEEVVGGDPLPDPAPDVPPDPVETVTDPLPVDPDPGAPVLP